jgi:membrane-associated phospholipid phosphatase
MNKYISSLGYQGPNSLMILILLTFAYQNVKNPYFYAVVIAWQFLNHLINITIKNTLKLPRPDSDKNFSHLKPTLENYLTIHRNFGMPSGHAQSVISELVFIALYFKNPYLTIVALVQTLLTLWQRYESRRHSIPQLIAGSTLGVFIGSYFYYLFLKLFYIAEADMTTSL